MKDWNVRVFREGRRVMLGQVSESKETLARCAALHKFGLGDDDLAMGEGGRDGMAIRPDDDFEVSPASRSTRETWLALSTS
jgi:hypothetical protein